MAKDLWLLRLGEAQLESDMDVLVEFAEAPGICFLALERRLSELLGVKVELVTRSAFKPQNRAADPGEGRASMKRTYQDYLEDMLLSAKEVLEFTARMPWRSFFFDSFVGEDAKRGDERVVPRQKACGKSNGFGAYALGPEATPEPYAWQRHLMG